MHTPEQQNVVNQQATTEQHSESASFIKTYESIEALFGSKITRLMASKNLIVAEAKLSLSAVLLSFAISLTLVVIAAVIWVLINIALGLIVVELTQSLSLSLIILLTLNCALALGLFKQLTKIWQLVGFSSVINNLAEGE